MTDPNLKLEALLPGSDDRGRGYVRVLLGLVVALLLGQALANYLINPLSLYGPGAMSLRDQRGVKVELLKQAGPDVQALILGSSRTRSLDPASVTRRFGLKTFNASMGNGGVQDWLAFTRWAVDERGLPIRLLIVGVDPSSLFSPADRLDHPAHVPELRRRLTHPWRSWLLTRKYLWSPDQTRESWRALGRRVRAPTQAGDLPSPDTPKKDPSARARKRFDQGWRSDGFNLNFTAESPKRIINRSKRAFRTSVMDPEDLRDFHALLAFARDRGITVILFVTPDRPALKAALAKTTHRECRRQTEELLRQSAGATAIFCDLSGLVLPWSSFVDLDHSGLDSGELILSRLESCARWNGAL